jgi:hypothetical protein
MYKMYTYNNDSTFPIYWVPQRVGSLPLEKRGKGVLMFPIYWVPQRVGRPE